jgi:hypothetical protein
MDDRNALVLVRAGALDDLCVLALTAVDELDIRGTNPALGPSLRGAVAEVRCSAVPDPTHA